MKDEFATEAQSHREKRGPKRDADFGVHAARYAAFTQKRGVDSRNFVVDGASPTDRRTYCNGTRAMERVPAPVGSGVMFP